MRFSQASTSQLLAVKRERLFPDRPRLLWHSRRMVSAVRKKPAKSSGTVKGLKGLEKVEGILVPGHGHLLRLRSHPPRGQQSPSSPPARGTSSARTPAKPFLNEEAFRLGVSNERTRPRRLPPMQDSSRSVAPRTGHAYLRKTPLQRSRVEFPHLRPPRNAPCPIPSSIFPMKPSFNPVDLRATVDAQIRRNGGTPP